MISKGLKGSDGLGPECSDSGDSEGVHSFETIWHFVFFLLAGLSANLERAPFLFFTEQDHVLSLERNSYLGLHHIVKKWGEMNL